MKYVLAATVLLIALGGVSAAEVYTLDILATRVGFDIEHFGLHLVTAHFRDFDGDFVFDRSGVASRVDVTVRTESIDCGDSHWNPHLRSPEWLDVQQYPLMTYHSHQIQFDGEDRAQASGDLTLHGVTRPVVLDVSQLRCPAAAGAAGSCSFVARARVKRSEYGLPHGFWTGGDQVDITITGVGTRSQKVSTVTH